MKQQFTTLRSTLAASAVALALSAAASGNHAGGHGDAHDAIGQPGERAQISRSVTVDMRFYPASIYVKRGETIQFVVTNSGQTKHEMVLGRLPDLLAHNEMMKKHPEMQHDEPNQITVAPGQSGEIIWRFTQPGKVNFACLQPGHFDAGMKGLGMVTNSKPTKSQHVQHH